MVTFTNFFKGVDPVGSEMAVDDAPSTSQSYTRTDICKVTGSDALVEMGNKFTYCKLP